MKQSRAMSLVEAIANAVIGYLIAIIAQMAILPIFGLQVTFAQHIQIGALFTLVSIIRGFALRRLFEAFRAQA